MRFESPPHVSRHRISNRMVGLKRCLQHEGDIPSIALGFGAGLRLTLRYRGVYKTLEQF